MKKKILYIIILFVFCISIFTVKAMKTSIDYNVVVNDLNGVVLNGSYKDEDGKDVNIKVTIPYNEKIAVLYEKFDNGVILGHIKYTTEITIKNVTDSSLDESKSETESTLDPVQGSGSYNNQQNNSTEKPNDSSDNNKEKNITNKEADKKNKEITEIKKKVEVEGDIDLSKCKVEEDFSLDKAIKFNKERKLMIINPSGMDLFKGPAMAYGKIDKIDAFSIIKYSYGAVPLDEKQDNTFWLYIKAKNGWIYNDPKENKFASYKKGRILIFDDVIVYKFPKLDSIDIDNLPKNLRKSFTYIYSNDNEEWYFVKYENKRGWVKNVAVGINAKINITAKNGVKLYKKPKLNSGTYDVVLPKDLEIQSIYKYSKDREAFYVEYQGKKGWIILENENNNPNFEVTYLKDNVKDPLLDKPANYKPSTLKEYNAVAIIMVIIFLAIIVSSILIIYAKLKRKKANDFSVSNINNDNSI